MTNPALNTATPITPAMVMAARTDYARLIFDAKYVDPLPPKKRMKRNDVTQDDMPVTHHHHILPKALFPAFARKKWNIVQLTVPEHFDAHVLLTKIMNEQIAVHRALYVMIKRYAVTTPDFDWAQAAESEQLTNEAASVRQSELRLQDWQNPAYRAKISEAISRRNTSDWRDAEYRAVLTAAINNGRQEKFYANPDAVARATAAQSNKTSGKNHYRSQLVNIYKHETGALVAEKVCLAEYCDENGLNQPHMHSSLSADRSKPSTEQNRTWSKGYFARRIDDAGNVVGEVCPAVPPKDHPNTKRADIFRAADNSCVARNVIITRFCDGNDLGIKLTQSALSRTAKSDRLMPSSRDNPLWHKGFYAIYPDASDPES